MTARIPKLLAVALLAAAVSKLPAQSVSAAAPTPAQLARYDTNRNGRLDPDELTALRVDEERARMAPTAAQGAAVDEIVELTPFEVREDNRGYYAATTMSGTRLNAKIEDLASSISVVTKQQMADFAMLDINDIFNYEASTEGTGNFTSFEVDRNGMVLDNVQNNPQGANRIRGMGAANMAFDNFATSGRVPLDPSMIDAVEISRGPNSNIFGLGEGSGTVNLIAASANLRRKASSLELRGDDIGGYRGSFDVNQPLIAGKLAVRANAVYQHDEYRQKPSGTTTRRYNVMVRAQPWKNTSIRATFQHYELYGTRASTVTPRDTVTYWRSLGSPTWDPVDNAVTVGGVRTVLTGTTNPTGLGGGSFSNPAFFVADGGIKLWMITRMPAATATNGPNNTGGTIRMLETVAPPVRAGRPLFSTVPGISDRSLFDYSSINLAGQNKIYDENDSIFINAEQFILNTPRNQLAVQFGWNHEEADRVNKNLVGQASATGNSNYLYVDVNSRLVDGRPNPFFLRPYLGVGEPTHSSNPYDRDTFRGQGAYVLDLREEKSWLRWLGRHQVVGYTEQRVTKQYSYRFREANVIDNPIYAPAGQPKANQSGTVAPLATRGYFRFYVGDNQGQNVDHGPSPIHYGAYTFNWFNPATNAWVADPGSLQEAAIQEGSAGTFASQTMIKTQGVVLQNTLFNERIVLTWGKRHDENYSKFQRGSVLKPNGWEFDYAAMDGWVGDWQRREGDTTTKGIVARPFRWTTFNEMARRGGAAGFVGEVLRGFSVHYNQSDSFRPEPAALSVLQNQLPNPSSTGKDYGFTLNLWDNKFVLRANRYEIEQINSRNGQFRTFADRVLRLDFQAFAGNNDAFALQRQARAWTRQLNPTWTDAQVEAAAYAALGMTPQLETTLRNGPLGETPAAISKGDEIELNFNPDRFFSFRANATRTKAIDANVAPNIPAWVQQRLPQWETIVDPRTGVKWLDQGYNGDTPQAGSATARGFLTNSVNAPINLARAIQGKNRNQIREWRFNTSASLRLAKFAPERSFLRDVTIGGSVRWEDAATIGYYGLPINGDISIATEFDPDRPIFDDSRFYVDAFASYTMRLFKDKVRARFQLNVRNLQESRAHLRPVGAYPDGTPHTFRVIDPRTFILTTTFEL